LFVTFSCFLRDSIPGITCIEAAELDPPHGEEDEVLNIIAMTKAPPNFVDPSCRYASI
jgi:hypothetical protein